MQFKKRIKFEVEVRQCCQHCGFPANLGLFFCGVAGFFEGLRVASLSLCFNWYLLVFWAVFFADLCFVDCFFSILCGTFAVLMYCLKHIGCVFIKICSFWAWFFGFTSLTFYLIFLLIFRFVEFSCQRMLGLFFGWITYF